MRHEVTMGRQPKGVAARRRDVLESLTAAGALILPTYELSNGSPAELRYLELAAEHQLTEMNGDRWPCEIGTLGDLPDVVFRDGQDVVMVTENAVVHARLSWGWINVECAALSQSAIAAVCSSFRAKFPASYLMQQDDRVPITFWSNSAHGPVPRLRKVESAAWEDITKNYGGEVGEQLASIMAWSNGPDVDGQLLLWQGPPGTGKTWALRALAGQWAEWAEFHYITDPDQFFVKDPSYMINVLLADSYSAIDEPTGDIYNETDPLGKWRVLILEDTGELLAANAKESYGQGLSRLLNVVDGMIGQGLRVLALVTTNDQLGDLHPAVSRPGRCASQIEFGPLNAAEASEWLGEVVDQGGTLAELYARSHGGVPALEVEEPVVASAEEEPNSEEAAFDELIELSLEPLPDLEEGDRERYLGVDAD